VIQTQMLSRVFVFTFSGEHYPCPGIERDSLSLTGLSLFSRGTLFFVRYAKGRPPAQLKRRLE
jgi:hypothetical protein